MAGRTSARLDESFGIEEMIYEVAASLEAGCSTSSVV